MKILHDVKRIDSYLQGKMHPAEKLLLEAQLLIDPLLARSVAYQRKLYELIRRSGRREAKREIERIHRSLFSDPSKDDFRREILKLFSKA